MRLVWDFDEWPMKAPRLLTPSIKDNIVDPDDPKADGNLWSIRKLIEEFQNIHIEVSEGNSETSEGSFQAVNASFVHEIFIREIGSIVCINLNFCYGYAFAANTPTTVGTISGVKLPKYPVRSNEIYRDTGIPGKGGITQGLARLSTNNIVSILPTGELQITTDSISRNVWYSLSLTYVGVDKE